MSDREVYARRVERALRGRAQAARLAAKRSTIVTTQRHFRGKAEGFEEAADAVARILPKART
jgi:hypothetical protein